MAEQPKPSNFVVRTDNLNEDEGPLFRPAEGIEVVWDTVPVSQRLKELEAEVEKWKVGAATVWQGQEAGSEWNRELRAENERLEAQLETVREAGRQDGLEEALEVCAVKSYALSGLVKGCEMVDNWDSATRYGAAKLAVDHCADQIRALKQKEAEHG